MFDKKLPKKRVVIAGCRNYNDYNEANKFIDNCLVNIRKENEIIIVSGGARGADALGERYAQENGFKIERHPAKWEEHGRAAGPMRNKVMAENCDYVICFWDGESSGTRSMIFYAKAFNKPIKIKKIDK